VWVPLDFERQPVGSTLAKVDVDGLEFLANAPLRHFAVDVVLNRDSPGLPLKRQWQPARPRWQPGTAARHDPLDWRPPITRRRTMHAGAGEQRDFERSRHAP
jgi:hypothetical protein